MQKSPGRGSERCHAALSVINRHRIESIQMCLGARHKTCAAADDNDG